MSIVPTVLPEKPTKRQEKPRKANDKPEKKTKNLIIALYCPKVQTKSCHKVGPEGRQGLETIGKLRKTNEDLRSPGTLGAYCVTLSVRLDCS